MYKFEDYLKEVHAKQYTGLDDDMPDDFENWLSELGLEDIFEYADAYGKVCAKKAKEKHD